MQFRTIRTALDHKGQVAHTRNLSPRSRGAWYCRSCNNPLRYTGRMTAAVILNIT
ncbi:Uncharacterised protein [Leclercia adecarboxylata]|uniref:DUF7828 domain-containing protein n=1 Tax=Leclercia adecarboxylata TaxID=83655 RepID=A0A4U9HLR7_9ENTR|nr:Uncharacterised protein [Leclercia adecarboxylata]